MVNSEPKVEKKRISILGCGWLGFRIAKRLLELDITSAVKGSTTSESKLDTFADAGIEGFRFDLGPEFSVSRAEVESFFDSDSLIIAIPPRLSQKQEGFHAAQINSITQAIEQSSIKEVIFISSTGVYTDLNKVMVESDVTSPEQSASPEMVIAENLLTALRNNRKVSVLRLGGLIGYERIPGKYVIGKKEMTTGNLPVNYIHPDDATEIATIMIATGVLNETFNIVAPLHPTRRSIYETTCEQFGWEAPTFLENVAENFKIISAEKFSNHYDYYFKFPDPLNFYYRLPG